MKSINWKPIVEFVGISALVASLIFVGAQIQLDRQVASAQVNMSALESRVAIEAEMAEYAEVWIKAAKQMDLTDHEKQVVERLVRMAESKAFFETLSGGSVRGRAGSERFPEDSPIIGGFSTLLFENPGARRIWLEKSALQDAYYKIISSSVTSQQFNNAVRIQLKKLDEAQKTGAFK